MRSPNYGTLGWRKSRKYLPALPFFAIFLGMFLLVHIITRPLERIKANILAIVAGDLDVRYSWRAA